MSGTIISALHISTPLILMIIMKWVLYDSHSIVGK